MAVPMIKSRFSIASIVKIVIYYKYCFCFGNKNKGKEVELMIALPLFLYFYTPYSQRLMPLTCKYSLPPLSRG